jgi:hypothetical protein
MDALPDSVILSVWERAHSRPPVDRALTLLEHTVDVDEAEQLPVGSRNAHLLDVYAATFGSRIETLTACPQCGEQLDVAFDVSDIRVTHKRRGVPSPNAAWSQPKATAHRYRPPSCPTT